MEVRPKAKYEVIYRHRKKYPISVMCCFFQVSRSGYYDFVHRLGRPERDKAFVKIIAEQRERSFCTYGCHRMWLVLKKHGIHRNPKTVLRIMEKYGCLRKFAADPALPQITSRTSAPSVTGHHALMHSATRLEQQNRPMIK